MPAIVAEYSLSGHIERQICPLHLGNVSQTVRLRVRYDGHLEPTYYADVNIINYQRRHSPVSTTMERPPANGGRSSSTYPDTLLCADIRKGRASYACTASISLISPVPLLLFHLPSLIQVYVAGPSTSSLFDIELSTSVPVHK